MHVFSATDVGTVRQVNQDYIYTSTDPVGNLPSLFVVADGMGGHTAGDFASRYGVSVMVEAIKKDENFNPIKIIRDGVAAANREVHEASLRDESMAGMGTTLVACSIADNYLYVANVGDSRLYVIDENGIEQITQDHSLIAEMVRLGEINEEDAKHHPDKNIITRAIGTEETVQIDFFDLELKPGTVVMMCSDGLYNMVENDEIFRLVREALEDEDANPAQVFVDAANNNGGKDNVAVIIAVPFDEVSVC